MFGYLRFFLAVCVIFSHTNGYFFYNKIPFDFGKMAVFGFYILAGLVSSKLIKNVFDFNAKNYLKDRFLRIFPMAWFWQICSVLVLLIFCNDKIDLNLTKILNHLALIPLNFTFFINENTAVLLDKAHYSNFILPPYFSLGVELQFYLFFAILLCFKMRKMLKICAYFSFAWYLFFSLTNTGNANLQIQLTYILLASTFWIFYLGHLIFESKFKEIAVFYLITAILVVWELKTKSFYGSQPFCSIAILAFVPLIVVLHKFRHIRLKFNAFLGSMSFVIYCNHYLFIIAFSYLGIAYNFVVIFVLAFVSGLVAYKLIEKPLNAIRQA
ncbi:acyltransferase [Campylobacter sp. JMF_01 NE2]|uniref:acyltransferase family protein n=1 Tax=unclassified Campylobacter TaxID=2593542 RepID=UPI0022E9F34C|nr:MULTISPECIES: acyltransferase [unclassified Campylobacter]MDA3053220.1 acyltransferase [Campylobacter sp. JMF_03 NE3]MDA3067597.1 acyltransferase [Campylobacter sp. JMF_01 NE2]